MPKITITTDQKTLEVAHDYPMIQLGDEHDTSILFGCCNGACGACMIKVKEGMEHLSPTQDDERDFLETMAADPQERLACQCRVLGDVTIEVSD